MYAHINKEKSKGPAPIDRDIKGIVTKITNMGLHDD